MTNQNRPYGAAAPQSEEQKRGTWEQQVIKRLGEPEDVQVQFYF